MDPKTAIPAVTLELDMDRCGLDYGNGPCNARLRGTEIGFVEKLRWRQGNSTTAASGYYDVGEERLIVNDIPVGSDVAPDLFRLGWRAVGTWNIGNGTTAGTARLLNGGGEIQISTTPLTGNILPYNDDPNNQYRIRITGNATTNGTSIPAFLDFRLVDGTSARYRFGSMTNLSSVFGNNEISSGGGILTIEKFNPATLTSGNWRIRRQDPNTTNREDVFSVGGLTITDDGVQAHLLVGGSSHAAADETGTNFVSYASWNAGDVAVNGSAEFDNVIDSSLPNGILVVNNTTLSGTLPTQSDSLSYWRLRRVDAPSGSPGTLMSVGELTVLPNLIGEGSSTTLIQVGDTAAMNAGFGTVDINAGGSWVLERGTRVRATLPFTSPMTNFAVDVASPETNTTPAYIWVLEKEEVLNPTTGSDNKCYNTWATCQDRENYVKDEPGRTFKFVTKGIVDLPGFSPVIKGHDHQPPAIKRGFDMWQREVVKVTIEDVQAPDTILDDDYIAERPKAGNKRVITLPESLSYVDKAEYIQGDPEDTTTGLTKAYISLEYGDNNDEAVLIVSNTALPGGTTPTAADIAGTWRLSRDGGGLPHADLAGGLSILETNSTHTIFRLNSSANMTNVFGDGVQISTVMLSYPTLTASWEQGDGNATGEAFFERNGTNAGNLIVNNTPATGTAPTTGRVRIRRTGGTLPTTSPSGAGYFGKWNVGDSEEIHNAEQVTNALSFNRIPNSSGDRIGNDNSIDNDEWFGIGQTATVIYTSTETETTINNVASWNAGSGAATQTAVYQSSGVLAVNDTELTGEFPSSTTGDWRLRRADDSAMTGYGTLTSVQGSGFKEIRVGTNAEMITAFGSSQIVEGSGWVLEQRIITPSGTATEYSGAVKSIAGLGLGNSPAGANYFGRWKLRTVIGATFATVDVLGHIDFHIQAPLL